MIRGVYRVLVGVRQRRIAARGVVYQEKAYRCHFFKKEVASENRFHS
jgi:hypothetical protein